MTDRKVMSRVIKELRESAGWNQAELARRAGVTPAAISQIEGENRYPSLIVARKLADAFGIGVDQLIGKNAPKPSSAALARLNAAAKDLSPEEIDWLRKHAELLKKKV